MVKTVVKFLRVEIILKLQLLLLNTKTVVPILPTINS